MYKTKDLTMMANTKLSQNDDVSAEKLFKEIIDTAMASKETSVKRDAGCDAILYSISVGRDVIEELKLTRVQKALLQNYCTNNEIRMFCGYKTLAFSWWQAE